MASKHPEENTKHEKDLPLMSNISDIHIFHYILQLKCVMENNEMVGCVTLFRCNEWIDCMRCPRKKIHKHRERRQIIEIDRKPSMEHNYSQKDSNMKEVVLKGHKSVPADEDRTQKTDKTDKTSGQEHDCYEKKSSTETGNKNEDHNPAMTDQERADTPPDPDFKMILDCNDIDIVSVEEVKVPVNVWRDINTYTNYNQFKSSAESVGTLNWICDKHSMSVWKEGVKCASNFPEVVRVRYKTKSTGQSLKWTIDQDRRSCVFTHGHWINNRSLFPSQDVPTAMATWQTEIQVRDHLTVVMGGDNIEIRSECDEIGWKKEYFNTRFEMPSSTLSVAIGYWETKEILLATSSISQKNSHLYVHSNLLMKSCRLIGPASLVTQVYPELDRYIPNCVTEVSKCLGPHPFSRLDILIVPPCFDSLGMAWKKSKLVVAVDAGWQKRGSGRSYDSKSGHCSMVGPETGKIINYSVRSKECRVCSIAESKNETPKSHQCFRNWEGSAKGMEADMVIEMVKNVESKGCTVGAIVGDEDSTTIGRVRANVNIDIEKISDRNHLKKILGNNLYSLKKKHPVMTVRVIKYLQSCFNYIIAQGEGNPEQIANDLDALSKHPFGDHQSCSSRWCRFINNPKCTFKSFPQGRPLFNPSLQNSLENLFEEYARNSSKLSKVGSTQTNESFNRMVAAKAPKNIHYSSSGNLNYRVAASVAQKNTGHKYLVKVNKKLGLSPGFYTQRLARLRDNQRVKQKAIAKSKEFKRKRLLKKAKIPSLMFVAQSLFAGDYSMCVRIAHEMCHSWFGLSIGPTDWTEEWLTEGFCSYMEDIIHLNVLQTMKLCDSSEAVEERQLRNYLKYKILQNEIQTTNSDLQMLRPSKGVSIDTKTSYVKDGMNPDKRFLQVHYLKGHFLLCYLEKFVGRDKFLSAIHAYVIRFHKELVSSKDVITFLFNVLPELREHGLTEDNICRDWLDTPGMPMPLTSYSLPEDNTQIKFVQKQVECVRSAYPKQGCRKRKKSTYTVIRLQELSSLQLVLFLEELLEDEKIPLYLLNSINNTYKPRDHNADVQHRWCELVIKHKHKKFYDDVKYFLLNHQAMGVYLYGEMVLSGCTQQKKLAEFCFNSLKTHMEPDPYAIVKSMIYGT